MSTDHLSNVKLISGPAQALLRPPFKPTSHSMANVKKQQYLGLVPAGTKVVSASHLPLGERTPHPMSLGCRLGCLCQHCAC